MSKTQEGHLNSSTSHHFCLRNQAPYLRYNCRVRQRESERERDKQKDLAKERVRQLQADNGAESDDEDAAGRRRPFFSR